MKFWSRVTRILLAIVVASQGAVFLPAMAASQSKRLAVKAIGIEELKSEYGAGGGGGGGGDPPPDPIEVVARFPIRASLQGSDAQWQTAWVEYGSEKSFPNALGTPIDYVLTYLDVKQTTYDLSGGFTTTVAYGASLGSETFSIGAVAGGGININGSIVTSESSAKSAEQRGQVPGYVTLYFREKYKTNRYLTMYAIWITYSDGSTSKSGSSASVYKNVLSTLLESKSCNRISGWCSSYY